MKKKIFSLFANIIPSSPFHNDLLLQKLLGTSAKPNTEVKEVKEIKNDQNFPNPQKWTREKDDEDDNNPREELEDK